MIFSKKSHEGELVVDHRASPGIPAPMAARLGFAASQVGEGALFECATYGCPHCQGVVIMNPQRVRERAWCFKCDQYICDNCDAVRRHDPDYVHRSVKEIAELVQSGKWKLSGSMGRPILTPSGD